MAAYHHGKLISTGKLSLSSQHRTRAEVILQLPNNLTPGLIQLDLIFDKTDENDAIHQLVGSCPILLLPAQATEVVKELSSMRENRAFITELGVWLFDSFEQGPSSSFTPTSLLSHNSISHFKSLRTARCSSKMLSYCIESPPLLLHQDPHGTFDCRRLCRTT